MKKYLFLTSILLSCQVLLCQNVGVNTTTPEAALDINGDIIIRPANLLVDDGITLALDVNTARFSNYRITGPTADFTLAGITAGVDGRLITLFNLSGFIMQLNNEDATVTPEDMIVTGTNTDITIVNKGIVSLQYDATEQKWIVKSSSKGSIGGGGYWDVNGSDIYNINTGNVGIGTTAPLDKLTVETDNNNYGITHRSIQGNILSTRIGGTTAGIGTFSPTDMRIYSGGLSRLIISQATGGVFIGTDNPSVGTKLTVQTLNNSYGIEHIGEGGNILSTRIGGTSAGIGTFSPTDMRIFSGSLSRIIISQATGGVFIGTDNPAVGTKLTVQTLNNSDGISHIGEGGNILSTHIGGSSAGIGTFSNTHMRLYCNGRSDLFIAAATGNVGIGTENFGTYKLAVNGNIRTKEVVVESGWADYVFEKKYKLPLLSDVEKFIHTNKHLPNIPSAVEIEKNGLQLGDMQKRMMEKIEELTLYIIEQQKQIKAMQLEMESYKKNNSFNF